MGASSSVPITPESFYKAVSKNNLELVKGIFSRVPAEQRRAFLEFQDQLGYTPLIIATASGYGDIVLLLIRAGANVHHVAAGINGVATTALHEAVLRGNYPLVEALLRAGANPFLENGQGLTSVDVAINNKAVALVRQLESGAAFAGWLSQKTQKYMGLGSEWTRRWCVVMARFPNPKLDRRQQVVRSLLVVYKSPDVANPSCKVWLDGARCREDSERTDRPLRCVLALHPTHAPPSGAYITGDPSVGYSLHFQAIDDTPAAADKLRRFMAICSGGAPLISLGAAAAQRIRLPPATVTPGPLASGAPASPAATQQQQQQQAVQQPRPPRPSGGAADELARRPSDEEIARQLQAKYDAEIASYLLEHPDDAAVQRLAGHVFPGTSQQQQQQASAGTQQQQPGEGVHYPSIDHLGNPSAPPSQGAGGMASAHAPPPSATVSGACSTAGPGGLSFDEPARPSGAVPGGQLDGEGECVVCLDRPKEAGFLHNSSVHKCCCRECAMALKSSPHPLCPVCRAPIEHVILNFY
jgi:hypothetical protein